MSFQPKTKHSTSHVQVPFADKKPLQLPTSRNTYTHNDFRSRIGQWIDFSTLQGRYRGMIEDIRDDAVLIKMSNTSFGFGLTNDSQSGQGNIDLAGHGYGHPHPYPYWSRGPWCWCWFPIIFIIFLIPCFWW